MDRIELSPVTEADAEFLYDLLKDRDPSANISHRELPTWEQHVDFVKAGGGHPLFKWCKYACWYVVVRESGGQRQPIGSIYLTEQAEIGIFFFKEFHGHGFGSAALDALMKKHPLPRYLANIAPGNEASQKFFVGRGFKHIQNTYELRRP